MRIILLIVSILLFFGCSVQKRKYQPGYYVNFLNIKKKTDENHKLVNHPNVSRLHKNTSDETPTLEITPKTSIQNEKSIALLKKNNFLKLANDSCDEIIFKDGTEMKAKVLEISSSEVRYKRCDMQDGPTYVAKRSEVFMIKYSNGTREVFKEETYIPPIEKNQQPQNNAPSYTNNAIIPHPNAGVTFVVGLLSLLAFFASLLMTTPGLAVLVFLFSIIGAIVATRLGKKTIRDINGNPNRYSGRLLALAGRVFGIIILSIIAFILFILILVLLAM